MSKIKNDAAKTTTKVCHNLAQVAVKMIMGCFWGRNISLSADASAGVREGGLWL